MTTPSIAKKQVQETSPFFPPSKKVVSGVVAVIAFVAGSALVGIALLKLKGIGATATLATGGALLIVSGLSFLHLIITSCEKEKKNLHHSANKKTKSQKASKETPTQTLQKKAEKKEKPTPPIPPTPPAKKKTIARPAIEAKEEVLPSEPPAGKTKKPASSTKSKLKKKKESSVDEAPKETPTQPTPAKLEAKEEVPPSVPPAGKTKKPASSTESTHKKKKKSRLDEAPKETPTQPTPAKPEVKKEVLPSEPPKEKTEKPASSTKSKLKKKKESRVESGWHKVQSKKNKRETRSQPSYPIPPSRDAIKTERMFLAGQKSLATQNLKPQNKNSFELLSNISDE